MRGKYILGFLAVVCFAVTAFGSVVLIGLREGVMPSPYTIALFVLGIIVLVMSRSHGGRDGRHSTDEKGP